MIPILDDPRHEANSSLGRVILDELGAIETYVDETDSFVAMPVRVVHTDASDLAIEVGPYMLNASDIETPARRHRKLRHVDAWAARRRLRHQVAQEEKEIVNTRPVGPLHAGGPTGCAAGCHTDTVATAAGVRAYAWHLAGCDKPISTSIKRVAARRGDSQSLSRCRRCPRITSPATCFDSNAGA